MQKNYIRVLQIFCVIFMAALLYGQNTMRIIDKFSEKSQMNQRIKGWAEKSFVGHTQYSIVEEDGNFILKAAADSAASGLYKKIKYDLKEYPYLSWRWKVTKLPERGDVHQKETDDYGARVYIVFPKFLKWKTKTISYIWANKLPKGESFPNPWLPKNVIMIAVESGSDSLGKWITEKRNVYEDYRRLFGDEAPKVGAIALMSDGDNTGGKAVAFYDDFYLSRKR